MTVTKKACMRVNGRNNYTMHEHAISGRKIIKRVRIFVSKRWIFVFSSTLEKNISRTVGILISGRRGKKSFSR